MSALKEAMRERCFLIRSIPWPILTSDVLTAVGLVLVVTSIGALDDIETMLKSSGYDSTTLIDVAKFALFALIVFVFIVDFSVTAVALTVPGPLGVRIYRNKRGGLRRFVLIFLVVAVVVSFIEIAVGTLLFALFLGMYAASKGINYACEHENVVELETEKSEVCLALGQLGKSLKNLDCDSDEFEEICKATHDLPSSSVILAIGLLILLTGFLIQYGSCIAYFQRMRYINNPTRPAAYEVPDKEMARY